MSTGLDPAKFAEAVADSSAAAAENLSASITDQIQGTFVPQPTNTTQFVATPTTTQFTTTPTTTSSPVFTAQQIEAAREQEKAKLYPTIEGLKEQNAALLREKEEREAADAQRQAEADAEARRLQEEEMSVRELLNTREAEWQAQLAEERRERETAIALLEQERNYQELQAWALQRVEQERDNIMPELLDLVTGNSPEEIEASIQNLKDRTSRIVESIQQSTTSARRDMVGTRLTAPAAGPLDTNMDQRQYSPEEIRNMPLSEYQKHRDKLLGNGAASNGRGIFG